MAALTLDDIRVYTRDIPELNILLEGTEQSPDELITLAMRLTIDDFNISAPVTYYTVENFPNTSLLLYGTLMHLANAESERQLRNQVNYSAQGLSAGLDDKTAVYQALAERYRSIYEAKVHEYKIYLNNENAWGEIYSPYSGLNQYRFSS